MAFSAALQFTLAFLLSACLAFAMLPLFARYATARPNARSSHVTPTPQGGGVAILLAIWLIWSALGWPGVSPASPLIAGVLAMGVLGAVDDLKALGWRVRLVVQGCIALGVLLALPSDWQVLPALPLGLERALALLLGLWFINLTNFMDGIDGLLVIGLAPPFLAIGTGFLGLQPGEPLAVIAGGALCGFLVLNRPKARLFAGDVGSLALGLLLASLLYALAAKVSLAAAILLPLYFVLDASSTLLMRLARGENLAVAHREHAYQRAFDSGIGNVRILAEVLLLNILLAGLAGLSIVEPDWSMPALGLGIALTMALITRFRLGGAG